jgi:hypothetical protein
MNKGRLGKAAGAFVFVATVLIGAANIGWNMYLLDSRPTVSVAVPDHRPDSWFCGKGNLGLGPVHCVLLSERDQETNTWIQASFLVMIPFFLALAIWKRARPPRE